MEVFIGSNPTKRESAEPDPDGARPAAAQLAKTLFKGLQIGSGMGLDTARLKPCDSQGLKKARICVYVALRKRLVRPLQNHGNFPIFGHIWYVFL